MSVAARQWEPVTDARVSALRLWARGWLLARPAVDREEATRTAATPQQTVPVARIAVPAAGRPAAPRPAAPPPTAAAPHPATFARPHDSETPR